MHPSLFPPSPVNVPFDAAFAPTSTPKLNGSAFTHQRRGTMEVETTFEKNTWDFAATVSPN